MYVYLAKKIAIPGKKTLHTVSWNSEHGWVVVGGDDGLLKVLKLGGEGGGGLSTQALSGHSKGVVRATWNSNYRKLTTADEGV